MTVSLSFLELGSGDPLVVLHGLFGSGTIWRSVARRLADRRRVLVADLRNHGRSPWDARMSYPDMAGDVARLVNEHGGGRADMLGHSMGGKAAMVLALTRPEAVQRLCVVDIAPVSSPQDHVPLLDALRRLRVGEFSRRGDADRSLAPDVPDPGLRRFLLQNLESGDDGRLRWRLNLDAIAHAMATLSEFPELAPEISFRGPARFIFGERSNYFEVGHETAIRRRFPHAEIETIENAGHWVHAEQPQRFIERVEAFLDDFD